MKSLPALVSLLLLLAADMPAQAPGSIDAEGNKYFPNGAGRYPLRRKGIWQVQRLSNPTGNLSRVPAITPSLTRLASRRISHRRGCRSLLAPASSPSTSKTC
jgi:hypothetical protein